MKSGATDYLNKPFNLDMIKIVVAKTLEKKEAQKMAKEALYYRELSRLDGMTGLFNHQALHHLLEAEMARATRKIHNVSLLMLDIDNFKQYNDTYGHPTGDVLLQELASLLQRSCRPYDLAARYGGEEFSIIAPETSRAKAISLRNRLTRVVARTKFPGKNSMPYTNITISIGIAVYPEDASNKEELITKADQALYRAKASGKNKICVWPGLRKI